MKVLLVHHADAVGPAVDAQRPLSELGYRQAAALAEQAIDAGVSPAMIWHSGKLRSRQTADAFLRACAPFAEFRMIRGLAPDDPPEWLRDILAAESSDILIVGHRPHIAALATLLSADATMPMHGAVLLERDDAGGWTVRTTFVPPELPRGIE